MSTTFLHHGILFAVVLAVLTVLYVLKRLPGIAAFGEFARIADTHGGNIAILAILTVFFFCVSLGFLYYVVDLLEDHTITPDNTMVLLILNWLTGSAFGTTLGALVKTMNSENGK